MSGGLCCDFVGKRAIVVQENDQWIADLKKWREYVDNVDHDLEGIARNFFNFHSCNCFYFYQ